MPYLRLRTPHEDQPNVVVLLVGSNDINKQTGGKDNDETIAKDIVNIFKCCITFREKKFRSSRPEVFCKKGVLRKFTKFTGRHSCQSLFFNNVAGLRPEAFLHRTPLVAAS